MQAVWGAVRESVTAEIQLWSLNSCENKQRPNYCDLIDMKGPAENQQEGEL